MAKRSRAQRRAENKAKQEKLNRERAEQQSPATQPPLPAVAPAESQEKVQAAQANPTTGEKGGNESRKSPPATRAEWTVATFTAVLSVFAIVQGIAMVVQNSIMRDQMGQTDKQIALTQKQLEGAKVVMRQTDNQLSEMKLQRQEMAKQGKLSEVSAKAAETSARASILSVEWANEIAKLQLSAYLAIRIRITAIKPVPKTGMHEVSLSITLKNYGQTPASKIQFRSFCPEVVGKPDAENTSDGCPAPPDGTLDLSPQQEYTIPFLTSVTHAQLEGLQKQKSLVWKVRPVVVFQNVFGEDFDKVQSFRAGGDRPFDVGEVLGGDDAGIREAGKKEPPKSPSEAADEKRAKINAPQVREERSILTPSEQPHRNNP